MRGTLDEKLEPTVQCYHGKSLCPNKKTEFVVPRIPMQSPLERPQSHKTLTH